MSWNLNCAPAEEAKGSGGALLSLISDHAVAQGSPEGLCITIQGHTLHRFREVLCATAAQCRGASYGLRALPAEQLAEGERAFVLSLSCSQGPASCPIPGHMTPLLVCSLLVCPSY